jgi:serine/threonine-protein kinase
MTYCRHGHQNATENRFCYLCGEPLAPQSSASGVVWGDRYRIKTELGQGGFGRTYLAEDLNRFNELCVLKEFAPQVQGTYALQKAEELFAREAGVLYQLEHSQIPRFRELFRANLADRGHLFLVQDYVDGQTYRRLLEGRRQQGTGFSEFEVQQLLLQILPVLHYIHARGVVHRDIAPDNLMLRAADQLPVLIDFGGVKQIAAAVSQVAQAAQPAATETRLGKIGYAPPEQMQMGRVAADSDLYALAVTALVLLTGKEPQDLFASPGGWQRQVNLSPHLTALLDRMLAVQPSDRYPSAQAVLQALSPSEAATQPPASHFPPAVPAATMPATKATVAVAGATQPAAAIVRPTHKSFAWGQLVLLGLVATVAGLTWATRDRWLPLIAQQPLVEQPEPIAEPTPDSPTFSAEEQARKTQLRERREALGIDSSFFIALTNATFYDRHPRQQGRTLTDRPEDAEWRERWDTIAAEWLDLLEQQLSDAARRQLGSYRQADRARWQQQVNQLGVGSRALNDLTDVKFFHLFPEQRGQTETDRFLQQPIGQVWQAIAADAVQSLQAGDTLEQIQFDPGTDSKQINGSIAVGSGQVYTAQLTAGQQMQINLQAPRTALLSIYLPRPTPEAPFLLADSTDSVWSGELPQSGIYEIVVVATGSQAIDYQLTVTVNNGSSGDDGEKNER